jgi:hypothetical protein
MKGRRENKSFLGVGTSGKGVDTRKGEMRVYGGGALFSYIKIKE